MARTRQQRAEVLSTRALNRALLERQMLLERQTGSAVETIQHLVAMQGQEPLDPYLGLWTRLKDFDPVSLADLITAREVVRAPLLRVTIHLATARDFLKLRPTLQPLMESRFRSSPFAREHADRTRVAAAEPRAPMFPGYASNLGSLLVDGFFRGLWKIDRDEGTATLRVEVASRLSKREGEAVAAEGMRVLEFMDTGAESRNVRITFRG